MSRLGQAVDRLRFARRYTLDLLAEVDQDRWFRMPSEGVTHVGWQVGHLAVSDYRLLLVRIRGQRYDDRSLLPSEYVKLFGRGSIPNPEGKYPTPDQMLAVLHRVRAAALAELEDLADEELDNPPLEPHRLFRTKLGGIQWCAGHEMLHTGQIGLLRRLLGSESLW